MIVIYDEIVPERRFLFLRTAQESLPGISRQRILESRCGSFEAQAWCVGSRAANDAIRFMKDTDSVINARHELVKLPLD